MDLAATTPEDHRAVSAGPNAPGPRPLAGGWAAWMAGCKRPLFFETWLLWGLSLVTILVLVTVWLARVAFPLELDPLENGAILQAAQIAAGASAYPPPSADFIPQPQTPLYSILLAGLAPLFGLEIEAARGLSMLWALLAFAGLWKIVRREGRDHKRALVAAALFAAGYSFAGRSLDLACADAQFLALSLWSLYLLRGAWGHRAKAIAAGLLMSAAFWSHPDAMWLILASALAALAACPKQLPVYLATLLVGVGLSSSAYILWTDGYFWRYLFSFSPPVQGFRWSSLRQGFWLYSLLHWPALSLLAGILVYDLTAPWWSRQRKLGVDEDERLLGRWSAYRGYTYWLALAGVSILGSGIGFAASGTEASQWSGAALHGRAILLAAVALSAVSVAVVLPERGGRSVIGRRLLIAQLLYLLVLEPQAEALSLKSPASLVSGLSFRWNNSGIPTKMAWERAQQRKEDWVKLGQYGLSDHFEVRHRGIILAPDHPLWNRFSGGAGHASWQSLLRLPEEIQQRIRRQFAERIESGQYAAIWSSDPVPESLRPSIDQNYSWAESGQNDARLGMGDHDDERSAVSIKKGQRRRSLLQRRDTKNDRLYFKTTAIPLPKGCRRLVDFEDATAQGVGVWGRGISRHPRRVGGRQALEWMGVGGQYYMSTEGSAHGTAQLRFQPRGAEDEFRMYCGYRGRPEGLKVSLRSIAGGREQSLSCIHEEQALQVVKIEGIDSDDEWILKIEDRSEEAALAWDEIWLCEP